jgi:hypothetical protein
MKIVGTTREVLQVILSANRLSRWTRALALDTVTDAYVVLLAEGGPCRAPPPLAPSAGQA